MKKIWIPLFLSVHFLCFPQKDSSCVRLLFAGDIMGHSPQFESAWNPALQKYVYDSCFIFVKPILEQSDIAIGNLEVTLAGPPYSGYPRFSSPDALAAALKNAGFDVLCTANNHAADRGYEGLTRTLNVLDSLKLLHTGTFRNAAEKDSVYPLFLSENGFRIALLNYSYSTNGMPYPEPGILNLIDTAQIKEDLLRAREKNPDITIAMMHWGEEYKRYPSLQQKQLAAFLFQHGADAVIGSHPHVVQPIEFISDSLGRCMRQPVIWSLGNFISNQRDRYRNGGIMAMLEITKDSACKARSLQWIPVYVYRKPPGTGQRYILIPGISPFTMDAENFPVQMEPEEKIKMFQFFEDCREYLRNAPEFAMPNEQNAW